MKVDSKYAGQFSVLKVIDSDDQILKYVCASEDVREELDSDRDLALLFEGPCDHSPKVIVDESVVDVDDAPLVIPMQRPLDGEASNSNALSSTQCSSNKLQKVIKVEKP